MATTTSSSRLIPPSLIRLVGLQGPEQFSAQNDREKRNSGAKEGVGEPGFTSSVPEGRLKIVQDCVAAYFQPSLSGLILEMEFSHTV